MVKYNEYKHEYPVLAHAIDQVAIAMRDMDGDADHGEAIVTLKEGHKFKITLDILPNEETEDDNAE